MSLPYNLNDKQSIIDYAKLLKGKTLINKAKYLNYQNFSSLI